MLFINFAETLNLKIAFKKQTIAISIIPLLTLHKRIIEAMVMQVGYLSRLVIFF